MKTKNRLWVSFFLILGIIGSLLFDIGGYPVTSIVMMCIGFAFTFIIGLWTWLNGTL